MRQQGELVERGHACGCAGAARAASDSSTQPASSLQHQTTAGDTTHRHETIDTLHSSTSSPSNRHLAPQAHTTRACTELPCAPRPLTRGHALLLPPADPPDHVVADLRLRAHLQAQKAQHQVGGHAVAPALRPGETTVCARCFTRGRWQRLTDGRTAPGAHLLCRRLEEGVDDGVGLHACRLLTPPQLSDVGCA